MKPGKNNQGRLVRCRVCSETRWPGVSSLNDVRCRVGSSEIENGHNRPSPEVRCRVGSSENVRRHGRRHGRVRCRVGSSEKRRHSRLSRIPGSLPRRQLRKRRSAAAATPRSSLPRRQLRKKYLKARLPFTSSLPRRQLRKGSAQRIRPRIPVVANALDFAETSVPLGRVVVGGADTWRRVAVEGMGCATVDYRRGASPGVAVKAQGIVVFDLDMPMANAVLGVRELLPPAIRELADPGACFRWHLW